MINMRLTAPGEGRVDVNGLITSLRFFEDETSARSFKEDLEALGPVTQLNIHINSPGGSVTEGSAMIAELQRHTANKTVHIDGMAASMASLIAMEGDEIIIAENGVLMVHEPMATLFGARADELDAQAKLLRGMTKQVASKYSQRSGLPIKKVEQMLKGRVLCCTHLHHHL